MKTKIMFWLLILAALFLFSLCGKEEERRLELLGQEAPDLSSLRPSSSFSGRIVFQSDLDGDNEIYVLTNIGLEKLTDNSWDDTYPRWSPDQRRIAFSANREGNYDVFIMEANGRNPVRITDSPQNEHLTAWFADGKTLLYSEEAGRQSHLWMIDLGTKEKKRVIPDFSGTNFLADCSPTAPLIAFTGKRLMGWDVFLFDRERQTSKDLVRGGNSCRPRFSPDGEMIVYVSGKADGKGDIWIMAWDGSGQQRVTELDETYDYFPSWSPDGKHIVFCSNPKSGYADQGEWALFVVDVSKKAVVPLFDSPGRDVFPDWAK
ncbi:MAG: DPP IV N-terminal domain-containing protein [Clostridiales bacterium]|nr:DPP IV N-terminal domain-containing protein [Clostridiales bacterium]